ncbi:hypothetical protein GCM10027275_23290 [Rhabdobacter roseus]
MILTVLFTLSSCEDFLETTPTDFLAPANYYNTEAELEAALAGVYNILSHNNLYRGGIVYLNGFEGDESYINRATLINYPFTYDYTATNSTIEGYWNGCYSGIARANLLLKNIDNNASIRQEIRDRVRGQALFLRGYYHFLLVQSFGGVPLLLEPTASVEAVDVARSSAKEVYDAVLRDMEQAEALVAPISTYGHGSRVSKSAVRGLLARVCLHMAGQPVRDESKYEDARKWAKMVIDDATAGHQLNPSYADIFIKIARDEYDIRESIWEAEFWGNGADAYSMSGNNARINAPASSNPNTGTSVAYLNVTGKLYDAFENGDLRKPWSIPNFRYNTTGERGAKTFVDPPTRAGVYLINTGKYRREYETLLPQNANTSPQNWPILRFADVLLMYAEAVNHLNGPTAEAVEAVNLVRRRAWSKGIKEVTITNGGSGYTSAPTVTFSGTGGAVATATVEGGRVTGLVFAPDAVIGAKTGSYTSAPTITLSGGGGSGATATATVYTPTDADVPASATASKGSFLWFLQEERLRELNTEGLRRHDLIRWGIFVQALHEVADRIAQDVGNPSYLQRFRDVTERHVIWPIPTRELTLNRAMTQNEGWN